MDWKSKAKSRGRDPMDRKRERRIRDRDKRIRERQEVTGPRNLAGVSVFDFSVGSWTPSRDGNGKPEAVVVVLSVQLGGQPAEFKEEHFASWLQWLFPVRYEYFEETRSVEVLAAWPMSTVRLSHDVRYGPAVVMCEHAEPRGRSVVGDRPRVWSGDEPTTIRVPVDPDPNADYIRRRIPEILRPNRDDRREEKKPVPKPDAPKPPYEEFDAGKE